MIGSAAQRKREGREGVLIIKRKENGPGSTLLPYTSALCKTPIAYRRDGTRGSFPRKAEFAKFSLFSFAAPAKPQLRFMR